MNQRLGLAMVLSWNTLVLGCSAGTAAVGLTDCGDSMTCCIKKHPLDPEGACGATATEIQAALGAGVAAGATLHLLVAETDPGNLRKFENSRPWSQWGSPPQVIVAHPGHPGRCWPAPPGRRERTGFLQSCSITRERRRWPSPHGTIIRASNATIETLPQEHLTDALF